MSSVSWNERAWRFACALAMAGVLWVGTAGAQKATAADALLQRAIQKEMVEGDLKAAIDLYKKVTETRGASADTKARAWLNIGRCYERMADANARSAYERVVTEYRGQTALVSDAQFRLSAIEAKTAYRPLFADVTRISDTTSTWMPDRPKGGSVSPSGRFVYVPSPLGGVFDVVTHESGYLVGAGSRDSLIANVTFSPDDRQVAFGIDRTRAGGGVELRVSQLPPLLRESSLGGGRVLVQPENVTALAPFGWSPDSQRIVAAIRYKDGTHAIGVVSSGDGSLRIAKAFGRRSPVTPALSPDGKYVVYDAPVDATSETHRFFLLVLESGVEIPLMQETVEAEAPVWTPDGRAVAFLAKVDGKRGMWMREVSGGVPSGSLRLLRRDDTMIWPLGFSRDGTAYYTFESEQKTGAIEINPHFLPNYDGVQLFLATLDGKVGVVRGPAVAVAESLIATDGAPRFSPDGRSISLVRYQAGGTSFIVRSLSGDGEQTYESFRGTWFHQRRAVLSYRNPGGTAGGAFRPGAVELLDLETRERRELFQPSYRMAGTFALSADDRTLFAIDNLPSSRAIVEYRVGDWQQPRRFPLPAQTRGRTFSIESIALSPDERSLALWTDSGLFRVNVDGTGWKELYAADPFDWGTRPVWMKDGGAILIAVQDPNRLWRLLRVPVEGGQPVFTGLAVSTPKDVMMDFDVSPDGSRIAFVGKGPTLSTSVR